MSENQGTSVFTYENVNRLNLSYIPGVVTVAVADPAGDRKRRERLEKLVRLASDRRAPAPEARLAGQRARELAAQLVPRNGLVVRISGPLEIVDRLTCRESFGGVTLEGPLLRADRGRVVVTVAASRDIDIEINDGAAGGEYHIGDTRGKLGVNLNSRDCVVTAGDVGNADLSLSGSCQATVKSVSGRLHAAAYGKAVVVVHGGKVDDLIASADSNGRVTFGGSAVRASLSVVGAGARIHVNRVVRSLFETFRPGDRIQIDHRPVDPTRAR